MSIAIVTGASSGMGRDFVRELKLSQGIEEFWLVARRADRMAELASELGIKAKIISADLSTPEGIQAVTSALEEEKPEVSFLVNAAGFGSFGTFDELDAGVAEKMIDLNIKATVSITHTTIPYMVKGGRIITLGSGSCFTPLPAFNIYSSGKVFVLHYTKSLNFEIKKYGLRATCFCPGWVETEFIGRATERDGVTQPRIEKMKPMLDSRTVVRGCVRAAVKGRAMYVTNWYTRLQHVLFKLLPDPILTHLWLGMLNKKI